MKNSSFSLSILLLISFTILKSDDLNDNAFYYNQLPNEVKIAYRAFNIDKKYASPNYSPPENIQVKMAEIMKDLKEKYKIDISHFFTKFISPAEMATGFIATVFKLNGLFYNHVNKSEPKSVNILVAPWFIEKMSPQALKWTLSHEIGHAQSTFFRLLRLSTLFAGSFAAYKFDASKYFWKNVKNKDNGKKKNFKEKLKDEASNILRVAVKYSSKLGALMIVQKVILHIGMQIEERRADRFANNSADEETLRGGLEVMKYFKGAMKVMADEKCPRWVPDFCKDLYLDPNHPTIDSRTEKINCALKDRFGIEL